MNARSIKTKGYAKRILSSIVLSIGMLSAVAQPAAAHKYEFRPVASHHYYYQYGRPVVFPRWLRKNHEFQRWYLRSDYRYIRGANWDRLYDMYAHERRHHKRLKRRFRGRVYVEPGRLRHRRYR